MLKRLFGFTKREWSYIFYDWAESAHTVIIGSFVFPILYGILMENAGFNTAEAGSIYGFIATGLSAFIAILSPILGTYAEYKGMKKKMFMAFFVFGILFSIGLSFYPLDPSLIWVVLILYAGSMIGYAGTNIFYDSFIVDVTSDERMDRVSTAGYAFGYIGGSTIPLVISLFILQFLPDLAGLPASWALDYGFRICFLLSAVWWLLFSIPFAKNVQQQYGVDKVEHPIRNSFKRLWKTIRNIKQYRVIVLFLIGYFFYIDGVHTIISMAIPFANDVIGGGDPSFNATSTLLPIMIVIQILAFFFALLFSFLSKKYKTKHLLIATILVYCVIAIFGFFVSTVTHFWILGILVATSQGGIQALSRSYFGKLVPEDKANEFFGFYSIFGRIASIMGPALVGLFTVLAGNQIGDMRYGILSLILLFIIGLVMFIVVIKVEAKEAQQPH